MTTHVAVRPAFANLVDLWAPVRQLGTGFEFCEGPVWHPREQHLLFSDMPGDVRRRWDRSGVREVMRPANKCNGMTYDADLNLIVCEHATSSLIRERPDGRREVLASHFEGQELNSPNDVVVKSDGAIYFSDPWYGRMPVFGVERPRQLGFQGVYRIPPAAANRCCWSTAISSTSPTACASARRRTGSSSTTPYSTTSASFRSCPTDGWDRGASSHRASSRPANPASRRDEMRCAGQSLVCGPGGVWVYTIKGELIGKLRVPELVGNLTWGGPDWRTLFLTATHSLYAVETKIGRGRSPI